MPHNTFKLRNYYENTLLIRVKHQGKQIQCQPVEKSNEDEVGAKGNDVINVELFSLCSKGLGGIPDAFGGIPTGCLTL